MSVDKAMLITNIVLAVLTGFYVILTYKLVGQSKVANELNRKTTDEQIRILTSPYIHCEVRNENSELYIILTNGGAAPAYDVDVWVSGGYNYDDIKDNEEIIVEKNMDDDEMVHIVDFITYPIFFHSKQVIAKLAFPILTDSVTVFLQYRDSKANNYSYKLWFIDDTYERRKSYQLASIEPIGNVVSPRVEISKEKLNSPTIEPLPKHITDFYCHCVKDAAIYQTDVEDLIEDRGEWVTLK